MMDLFTTCLFPSIVLSVTFHQQQLLSTHPNLIASMQAISLPSPNLTTHPNSPHHHQPKPKPIWVRNKSALKTHTQNLNHSTQTLQTLLESIANTTNEHQLHTLLSSHPLSFPFLISVLAREPDWRRSLAILDWIHEVGGFGVSVIGYNIVIRNVMRCRMWEYALKLFDEMRERGVRGDRFTYSMLVSGFGKAGMYGDALALVGLMEEDRVVGDVVLYGNVISLCWKMGQYEKAVSVFSTMKQLGIQPDMMVYNVMISVFGMAKMYCQAADLVKEMKGIGLVRGMVTYSTLLGVYVANGKLAEAVSVFDDMNAAKCELDLRTCNMMIDVYGQLGMAKEADVLFWSMRKMGIEPNVVSYNTMLRVYGDAELCGEAAHLFQMMQSKGIQQNIVTYNTMIKIYKKTCEHEEAERLVELIQEKGIEPNWITFSTIVSIWIKTGKLRNVAKLLERLRSSAAKIDDLLYLTAIVTYRKVGLLVHSKRLLHELKRSCGFPTEIDIRVLANAGQVEEATWASQWALNAGEARSIVMFRCMLELYSKNKMFIEVIEVFGKMRLAGHVPDSDTIALAIDAFGNLTQFEKADALYREMQEKGCDFSAEVHFKMLNLYGLKGDFDAVAALLMDLDSDENINKKELHLVVSGIYERANRPADVLRIKNRMIEKGI